MLFAAILANPNPVLVKPALVAWLVAATTHLAFHVGHLQGFSAADGTAQTMGLALSVLLSAVVL